MPRRRYGFSRRAIYSTRYIARGPPIRMTLLGTPIISTMHLATFVSKRTFWILGLLGAAGYERAARAQTVDASILGSVRDLVGANVAGASVTVKNASTGVEWSVVAEVMIGVEDA